LAAVAPLLLLHQAVSACAVETTSVMPPPAGTVSIFASSQEGFEAAETRILDLAGESVKVRVWLLCCAH
jgi:hypothetical protein